MNLNKVISYLHSIKQRIPEKYQVDYHYTNGKEIVIMGEPSEQHNCDAMGCGSFDHVLIRIPFENIDAINEFIINKGA